MYIEENYNEFLSIHNGCDTQMSLYVKTECSVMSTIDWVVLFAG